MNRILVILAVLAFGLALFIILGTRKEQTGEDGRAKDEGTEGRSAPKVLRLALDTDPKTLDPIAITDTLSDGVARKIFNTLVRLEKDGASLKVVGDLAERFAVSPDGKTYTFELRGGVRFHNGREVKAKDAVYSLSRLLAQESKRPEWLKPMVEGSEERYRDPKTQVRLGIEATGEYTLEIRLTAPFAPFIQHLCTSNCAIVPREAVERTEPSFARQPVGTGPFRMARWEAGQAVVLKRNEGYFRGAPKLSEVRFQVVRDPNTRLERFLADELDACDIPYGRMEEAVKRAGADQVLAYNTYRTNYLGFGFPNGEFKNEADLRPFGTNKLLRQALNLALDREHLCDRILEGRGIPAKSVLPPGMPGYVERSWLPKDLAKAKELLRQAGYPDGRGLAPLTLLHRNDPNTRRVMEAIAHDFEQLGVRIELQARDWSSFLEMVEVRPRPCFALGWVADYPDPDNFLHVLFHSSMFGQMGNHCWYSNPRVDELTARARAMVEMKDRAPLYQAAEDLILDECPWICTYHVRNVVLLSRKVKGLRERVTPLDTGTEFPQVEFGLVDKDAP